MATVYAPKQCQLKTYMFIIHRLSDRTLQRQPLCQRRLRLSRYVVTLLRHHEICRRPEATHQLRVCLRSIVHDLSANFSMQAPSNTASAGLAAPTAGAAPLADPSAAVVEPADTSTGVVRFAAHHRLIQM